MEKIYLAIIILYIVYKIIYPVYRNLSILKLFGYKRENIKGYFFVLRKLAPLDFISEEHGFPMGLFSYKKANTIWEQMTKPDDKKETPEERKKRVELMRKVCEKGVVYWPGNLKIDDFFDPKANRIIASIAMEAYRKVLDYNFKYLREVQNLNKNYVIHIAELCAKFGKAPHEHLKKSAKFTDLEAYIIDEFFFNTLMNEKINPEIEKRNAVIKKGKK